MPKILICVAIFLIPGCNNRQCESPGSEAAATSSARQAINETPAVREVSELEYDREAFERLSSFLATDRAGMRIDDFLGKVGLEDARYTLVCAPRMPEGRKERLYHFGGFYMLVGVDCILTGDTYTEEQLEELHERNEVVIGSMFPVVRIDGLQDAEERIEAFSKVGQPRVE